MYNEELLKKLERMMSEKEISQATAAKQIGVSTSALSQYRRKVYDNGNIESVEQKISEWLDLQETALLKEKQNLKQIKSEYLATSVSEDIYKRIQYCQLEKGMVILHGDAGIGKTKSATHYVNDHPNSCIYVQISPSTGSLGNVLRIVAEKLKIPPHYNRSVLSNSIKERLRETGKLVIIDEAQHMALKALEELRNISDPDDIRHTDGTGIVLIGNTEVYDKMMGRASASFAQLFSRIKMHKRYTTNDIKRTDVQTVFTYLNQQNMKKEIDFLFSVARSKWGIRGAVNVYNNAVNCGDVTYDGLYAAARDLGIGVF